MKFFLLLFLIFSLAFVGNAQQHRSAISKSDQVTAASVIGFDKSKLTFGGGMDFQFGNYTLVDVSPQVGYSFSKYINAGVGVSYLYYKDNYKTSTHREKDSRTYLGMNVYARVYPVEWLVFMIQPEAKRMWQSYELGQEKLKNSKFISAVVVGAGLKIGQMMAMLKYDLVQDKYSPYGNRIFYSVGYIFGL